jgi:formamidopyrimidine-DNA glycosylase
VPELPDIVAYLEGLERHVVGRELRGLKLGASLVGRTVRGVSRIGKRLVLSFDDQLNLVIHLMIAGRLRWRTPGGKGLGKPLATFDFGDGLLLFTEAGTKRRASFTVVQGREALAAIHRGGIEPLECPELEFLAQLRRENHTLKRTLTDPRLFSGIGNAYSDEILHHARLSPLLTTARLSDEQGRRLYDSTRAVLLEWMERLRTEIGAGFPETVTAFRPEMKVHGRYGQPCPDCGTPVQRIRYADNETNYCARCQTEGRLLADRALSRLLKASWPKRVDDGL